jgi:hypothetical protein
MAISNCIVGGNGKVLVVDSPPLSFGVIDVVIAGKASGAVFLLWGGKPLTISSEIESSVAGANGIGIVSAKIDASSTPNSLDGGTVEVHAKGSDDKSTGGYIGFKTIGADGSEEFWTGKSSDGDVTLLPVGVGAINTQPA